MAAETQRAYLDVHLSTLQEAQSSVACAVRAQGYQLLELLQVEPEFSSSERARDRPSSQGADCAELRLTWLVWDGKRPARPTGLCSTVGLPVGLGIAPDSASRLEYLDPSPGIPSWPR